MITTKRVLLGGNRRILPCGATGVTVMGQTALILLSLVSGCAGNTVVVQPAAKASPVIAVSSTPAVPPDGDAATPKRIAEAKKLGYSIINQDGEELYCHTSLKTGSHVQKETTCLTAAELDMLGERSRQGLLNTELQSRPPQGR